MPYFPNTLSGNPNDPRGRFTESLTQALQGAYGGLWRYMDGGLPSMTDTPTPGQSLYFVLSRRKFVARNDGSLDWNLIAFYPTNPYVKRMFWGILKHLHPKATGPSAGEAILAALKAYYCPSGNASVKPAVGFDRTLDPGIDPSVIIDQALTTLGAQVINVAYRLGIRLNTNFTFDLEVGIASSCRYEVIPAPLAA